MKSIKSKLKRLSSKFLFIIFGFACLWSFSPEALAGVLDLGSYYKKSMLLYQAGQTTWGLWAGK